MLRTLAQITVKCCLNHARRTLFILAAIVMMAAGVVADCTRETKHIETTQYGGRQFDTFVSCGSSAGNFAYTCAENGMCYEDTSVNADEYCSCSNGSTQ